MRQPPRPRCTMPLRPTAIDAVDETPLHQLTYLGITCSKTMPPRGGVTPKEPPSSDLTPRSRVSPGTSRHEAGESQQRPLQQGNGARDATIFSSDCVGPHLSPVACLATNPHAAA
jgi:hypothetical protein